MRLLIMDDHQLIGEVLSEYLRQNLDVEVNVAMCHADALNLISETGKFECFLADLRMPGVYSVLELKDLVEANAPFPTYIFSGAATSLDLTAASMVGVAGILRKCTPVDETAAMISKILADPTSVPEELKLTPKLGDGSTLSHNDFITLHHLAEGASNYEIADALGETATSVEKQLKRIYRTLGVSSRLGAASFFTSRSV